MSEPVARGKVRTEIGVMVTRADGTVDDYGTVSRSDWGPLGRWLSARRIRRLNRRAVERGSIPADFEGRQ
jgi:hypothetical protein